MIPVLAAAFVGVFFATVSSLFVRPDRPLPQRIRPYTLQARSKLGAEIDVETALSTRHTSESLVGLVGGPFRKTAVRVLETAVDATDGPDELSLRLRRAGFADAHPATYRRRQLNAGMAGGPTVGVFLAWLGASLDQSPVIWGLFGVVFGFSIGAVLFRLRLQSRAESRSRTMKIEAYSFALMLSMVARLGLGPVVSLRRVGLRATGQLAGDVERGLQWLSSGSSTRDALERLAKESPDPATSRLFRTLGDAADSGHNAAAVLRSQAEELRKERQEQLDQLATKRRSAMMIPTLLFMFPVIVLYALAPGPSILFGL